MKTEHSDEAGEGDEDGGGEAEGMSCGGGKEPAH